MAKNFYTDINLNKNELQLAVVQVLSAAPVSPAEGQIYYNSSDNNLYYYTGASWVSFSNVRSDIITDGDKVLVSDGTENAKESNLTTTIANALAGLTEDEITQLKNIDGSTISPTQWGYVGDMDQGVSQTDSPTFASVTVTAAPVNNSDLTNKEYVDGLAAGLDPKESVRVATDGNPLASGAYNPTGGTAGTGSFTGAPTTLDTIALADGNRVLVKDQADPKQNGIYTVVTAATGTWERSDDQDGTPLDNVSAGNYTYVEQGAASGGFKYVLLGDGVLTLNTNNLVWTTYSGAPSIITGAGLDQTGNKIFTDVDPAGALIYDVVGDNGKLKVKVDGTTIIINASNELEVQSGAKFVDIVTPAELLASHAVPHNLNSDDCHVETYDASTGDGVVINVNHNIGSPNQITVSANNAPNNVKVVVSC